MSSGRECGADAAAYALGALEPPEAEAFRRHMETCAVCQDEVAAFREAVDALPLSAPQYPAPRGLRRRVVRAARAQARVPAPAPARRGWLRPPALAGGMAAVAAAAVVAVLMLSGQAATRVIRASVVGGSGSAQLRVSGDQAELVVAHFPTPPAGHIYEVWLERPHRAPAPTSALFSVTADGSGAVAVPGSLRGVSAVLVTPEPDGGSSHPTHAPVIVAHL